MKINLGAGPYWHKDGWHVLDHKLSKPEPGKVNGDISKINLSSKSCDVAFTSHVIEHIPHLKIQKVFTEINRVLKNDGVLRILVPDMEKFAQYNIENRTVESGTLHKLSMKVPKSIIPFISLKIVPYLDLPCNLCL